jgi:hypothetical protein
MNRKTARVLQLFIVVAGISDVCAQALQCTDIARTLKEFSISTSSSSYLNSVFDSYCESSGESKQAGVGIGLDMVVKAIPIKFSGSYSSSQEAMKNFCKNYSSSTSLQERKYSYEERIASKALDTVSDCLRLQSQGITITHVTTNREATDFFLKSGVDQKISLNGVNISGPVSCTGQISGVSKTMNEATHVAVSTSQNINCKRKSEINFASNVKVYQESVITIATNFGNYNVLWPRDERLPEDMASVVGKDLEELKGSLQRRKLQCSTTELQSAKLRSASVEALIPSELRNEYRVTGGGCEIPGGPGAYGHNSPIIASHPTANGWFCQAADPPNIPVDLAVKAFVIYCRDSGL